MKSRMSKACDVDSVTREKVKKRDGYCCVICGNPHGIQMAHYIPRSRGGLGIKENLVSLCVRCHTDFDNGGHRVDYKFILANYLKSHYPDWKEQNLIYNKYDWSEGNG